MVEMTPINEFETAILSVKKGLLPTAAFVEALLSAQLNVPSTKEIGADGYGLEPLFFDKGGVGMLVAFSDRSRMSEYLDKAPYCLMLKAADLIRMMPTEYGLVVNPGAPLGFDIPPSGIAEILHDFNQSKL